MVEPEAPRKSFLDRLPKLSRVSQLLLLIGIFLVLFIPLLLINQQQGQKQDQLRATLANLQKALAAEDNPQAKLQAELEQLQAETESARATYPHPDSSPEILDSLLELAELNDIHITSTSVATSQPKEAIGPVITVKLGLKGQVPRFQNFLLALDERFPSSRVKQLSFTIATEEGEEDTASLTIEIYCYEASE